MKYKLRILGVTILFLVFSGIYWYSFSIAKSSTNKVLKEKENQLKVEFYKQIDECFLQNDRLMYSTEYGNTKFTPMDMAAVNIIDNRLPSDMLYYINIDDYFPYGRFNQLVSTMFKCLKPGSFKDLDNLYAVKSVPWEIFMLRRIEESKFEYLLFRPVAVGYLKCDSYLKPYRPSLENCCEMALEYITKVDKDYTSCYDQSNIKTIKKVFGIYNRYYYLQDNNSEIFKGDFIDYASYTIPKSIDSNPLARHYVSYIYNNYYRVYYDIVPIANFSVDFNYYNYRLDWDNFYYQYVKKYSIIYGIILLLLLTSLAYIVRKKPNMEHNKILNNYSSLKDELLVKCNPENFLTPYNKEKVVKANEIFKELKENLEQTDDELIVLRNRAINELKIPFDTTNTYAYVIEHSNPKKFLDPYNPQKLIIANEIYSQALQNKENIDTLEQLIKRIKNELDNI